MEDFYDAVEKNAELLITQSNPVDVIIDMTGGEMSFNRLLSAAGYVESKRPENQRLLLVVNASAYLRAIVGVASTFAPKSTENLAFVDTLQNAVQYIEQFRKNELPSL